MKVWFLRICFLISFLVTVKSQSVAENVDIDEEKLEYAKGSMCSYCNYCQVSDNRVVTPVVLRKCIDARLVVSSPSDNTDGYQEGLWEVTNFCALCWVMFHCS